MVFHYLYDLWFFTHPTIRLSDCGCATDKDLPMNNNKKSEQPVGPCTGGYRDTFSGVGGSACLRYGGLRHWQRRLPCPCSVKHSKTFVVRAVLIDPEGCCVSVWSQNAAKTKQTRCSLFEHKQYKYIYTSYIFCNMDAKWWNNSYTSYFLFPRAAVFCFPAYICARLSPLARKTVSRLFDDAEKILREHAYHPCALLVVDRFSRKLEFGGWDGFSPRHAGKRQWGMHPPRK